MPSFAGVFIF